MILSDQKLVQKGDFLWNSIQPAEIQAPYSSFLKNIEHRVVLFCLADKILEQRKAGLAFKDPLADRKKP